MRKGACGVAVLGGLMVMGVGQAFALSSETAMLLDLLQAKGVITQKEAVTFTKTLEEKMAASESEQGQRHTIETKADQVERVEGKGAEGPAEIFNKVRLSGVLAANLTASRSTDAVGGKTRASDVVLDTAQLSAEAEINQYVNGRLAFLYEEGENNDNIALDEAALRLRGGESYPLYATVGRQYLPFGHFASRFISDPAPLILGETNDTAMVAGYANGILDVNVGAFGGTVKEMGRSDQLNSAVASASLALPKSTDDGLAMSGGVSYLSNLAASDSLEGLNHDVSDAAILNPGEVVDAVGGWSAFVSLSYGEWIFFDAEYLGAAGDFAVGDFSFVDANNRRPETWTMEAAARIAEKTELALRYGGSRDGLTNGAGTPLTAQDEYGAAVLCNIFDSTTLTLEYLYQKFQGDSTIRLGTVQLAVEF